MLEALHTSPCSTAMLNCVLVEPFGDVYTHLVIALDARKGVNCTPPTVADGVNCTPLGAGVNCTPPDAAGNEKDQKK